jgi:hypothetical protein
MRILVELFDARMADFLRASLSSTDEVIRSLAAQGLVKLHTSDAADACLATINDAPDLLHADLTPSVHALAAMGVSILPQLLPLLMSTEARTRQRAQKVLERVTWEEVAHTIRPRPLSDAARTAWAALWEANGSYQWDATEAERVTAIDLWAQWLRRTLSQNPS